jgi:preprotein translocase subunit YajC
MNNQFLSEFVLFAVPIAIIWLVVLRPQQVQKRRHEEAIMAVKKGDEIVTAGGIIGDVIHIKTLGTDGAATLEDRLTIRSGESKLLVERGRIAHIVAPAATQAVPTKTSASASGN